MLNFMVASLLMTFSSVSMANANPYLVTESGSLSSEDEPPSYTVEVDAEDDISESSMEGEVKGKSGEEVSVEEYVKDYFSGKPVMVEIARCESTFRHYDENGEVLRGVVNGSDVGVMQINLRYHGEIAEKNGFDLFTIEGNLGYAEWLYERQGTAPWVHSSKCWRGR